VGARAGEIEGWLHPSIADEMMKEIDDRIRNSEIDVLVDGKLITKKGFTESYGIGQDRTAADAALFTDKAHRFDIGE